MSEIPAVPETVLQHGDKVFFKPRTELYGLAGFTFCFEVKRGKLKSVTITPDQQEGPNKTYKVYTSYCKSWSIDSWTHKGISTPSSMRMCWCKFHKSYAVRITVPPMSNCFMVSILTDLSFNFDYEEKKK